MYWDVVEAEVIGDLELAVRFVDGLTGRVKFEPSHLYGVFDRLRDPAFFSNIDVSEGYVRWSPDIDLAPDAMYQAIKREGIWVLR